MKAEGKKERKNEREKKKRAGMSLLVYAGEWGYRHSAKQQQK